ncbi:unnamed protein product, partial [Discosporangium mesarthrocarpum]
AGLSSREEGRGGAGTEFGGEADAGGVCKRGPQEHHTAELRPLNEALGALKVLDEEQGLYAPLSSALSEGQTLELGSLIAQGLQFRVPSGDTGSFSGTLLLLLAPGWEDRLPSRRDR